MTAVRDWRVLLVRTRSTEKEQTLCPVRCSTVSHAICRLPSKRTERKATGSPPVLLSLAYRRITLGSTMLRSGSLL